MRGRWIEAERVRNEPPRGRSQNVSALESNWTSKKKTPLVVREYWEFLAISTSRRTFSDVLKRYWMVGRGRFGLSLRCSSA